MTSQPNNNKDRTSGLNEKKTTQIGTKGMASNQAPTSQDTHEIATNPSNLHLTSRVREV